ncbi:hypothetical protein HDV05_007866, partial [Chytridiales sp. JEL 0842]
HDTLLQMPTLPPSLLNIPHTHPLLPLHHFHIPTSRPFLQIQPPPLPPLSLYLAPHHHPLGLQLARHQKQIRHRVSRRGWAVWNFDGGFECVGFCFGAERRVEGGEEVEVDGRGCWSGV